MTHLFDDADLADLLGVAHQFQRWVPKSYEARVIVVGERLFVFPARAGVVPGGPPPPGTPGVSEPVRALSPRQVTQSLPDRQAINRSHAAYAG